jgi:hypothetical protein
MGEGVKKKPEGKGENVLCSASGAVRREKPEYNERDILSRAHVNNNRTTEWTRTARTKASTYLYRE